MSNLDYILFSGKHCKPCDNLKQFLKEVHPTFQYELVDAFEDDRAMEYRIRATPTFITLDNGKVVDQITGYKSSEDKDNIEKLVFKQLKY